MPLTPEERQKILEEEEFRQAAPHELQAQQPKPKKKISIWTWIIIGVGGLFFGVYLINNPSCLKESKPSSGQPALIVHPAREFVNIASTWERGGFDNVAIADLKFTNSSERPIKDIEVMGIFYGESGTEIDRLTKVITVVVPAGNTKWARQINFGLISSQVKRAGSRVVDAKYAD